MEKIKFISLVIPTYHQEKTLKRNIVTLQKVLSEIQYKFEILIVADGELNKVKGYLKGLGSNVRIIGYEENNGKGFAVKYGMLRADGDVIGFIDSDMDVDPNGISMLINHMIWYDADIVIGSKLHPVSQVNYPLVRKILSWGYRSLIRVLFGLKIRDSQVGLKLYRRNVVRKVFPKIVVKKFAFDIETLAVANELGFGRIYEAPIKLHFHKVGSVVMAKFWKTIFWMTWDTFAVFYRLKILRYYQKA